MHRMLFVLSASILVFAGPSDSATLRVPAEYGTISAAVDAALAGDEVVIARGTYSEAGLAIAKNIEVRSEDGDPSGVVVTAGGADRIFTLQGNVRLSGLTLTEGVAPDSRGGAVRAMSGQIEMRNCKVSDSRGDIGGGLAVDWAASVIVEDCEFVGNGSITESGNGGAIHSASAEPLVVTGCSFESNSAGNLGGALALFRYLASFGVAAHVEDCTFRLNPGRLGGAIACTESAASLVLVECEFEGNGAGAGGALFLTGDSSILAVEETSFLDNTALGNGLAPRGGAVHLNGQVVATASGCLFRGNQAGPGGALWIGDGAELEAGDCMLRANGGGDGGAVHVSSGELRAVACRFSRTRLGSVALLSS